MRVRIEMDTWIAFETTSNFAAMPSHIDQWLCKADQNHGFIVFITDQ